MKDLIKSYSEMFINNLYNVIVEEYTTTISISQLLELLNNSIEKQYLIIEEIKKFIQLPKQLILLVKNNIEENQLHLINGNDILNCFNKEIFKTNNLPNILIGCFDFNNKDQFIQFIHQCTSELELTEKENNILNLLIWKIKSANGIFTDFNKLLNANLLLLNSTKYTQRTIEHELTHYLQKYTKYGLIKCKINTKLPKLDYIDLNEEQISFYLNNIFNKKEFIPTIDNLINDLNILYKTYYKKISEKQFILEFIKIFSSKDKNIIFNSLMYKQWEQLNLSQIGLITYIILRDISPRLFNKVNLQLLKEQI